MRTMSRLAAALLVAVLPLGCGQSDEPANLGPGDSIVVDSPPSTLIIDGQVIIDTKPDDWQDYDFVDPSGDPASEPEGLQGPPVECAVPDHSCR